MANNVNNGITGVIDIPGALRSRGAADGNLVGGVVAYAGDIYDATLDKNLAEVNSDLTEAIGDVNDSISSIQDDISPLTGSLSLQYLAEYDKLEVYKGERGEHNEVYIDDKNLAMNFGCNNTISNDRKLAFGFGQQLNVPDNTFVIGQRNSYEPNAAFIVGNGTLNGSTNNAFVIGRDGNFWVYGINGYAGQLTGASQYNSVNDFISDLDTRLTTLESSSSSSAPTYSAGTGISISNDTISVDSSTYKVKDVQDGNGDSLVSNGIASVTASNIYDSNFSYLVFDPHSKRYEDWYEYNLGEQQPYDQSRINSLLLSKYPNNSFVKLPNQACGCAISDYDVATGQNSLSNQQSSIGDLGSEYTNSFELSYYVPLGSIVRDDSGRLFNIKKCDVYNQSSLCLLDGFVSNLNTATVYGNAYGKYSHVEGGRNSSFGAWSHAEGYNNSSIGEGSHAEGRYTVAVGEGSHAEGKLNGLPGYGTIDSFTEDGNYIILTVTGSVGSSGCFICIPTFIYEGLIEIVDNLSSSNKIKIAKPNVGITLDFSKLVGLKYLIWDGGQLSGAIGVYSHTEGSNTSTIGAYSHAEGSDTITTNFAEHASGKYNKSNKAIYNKGLITTHGTLFSIGTGINDSDRENAFEVFTNGQVYIKGIGDYDGTNPTDLGVKSVQQVITELTLQIAALTNNL